MHRRLEFLLLLVAILFVLSLGNAAGLTLAAPLPPTAPPPKANGVAPSSSPTGAPAGQVAPIPETPPSAATANGTETPAVTWNHSVTYLGNTFKPRENDVNYRVTNTGGCVYVYTGNVQQVWDVGVTLPEGAQVQWLRMYTYDAAPNIALKGWFSKYDHFGNLITEWPVQTTTSGYQYTDVLISPPETIDYNTYTYAINWQPGGAGTNLQLCGFRLFFYLPTGVALPMIMR